MNFCTTTLIKPHLRQLWLDAVYRERYRDTESCWMSSKKQTQTEDAQ